MNFELTEEQKMARDMAREFAEKEIKPVARELDREAKFPAEIVKKMAKLGMFGVYVPEVYGGAGMDVVSYALMVEEISRACAGTGVIMSAHTSLVVDPIMKYGTEEQKKKYLPLLASGKAIGAHGMTEPEAGTDIAGIKTRAVKDGNEWVINGRKIFITNGREAGIYLIFAKTDPELGHKGLSAFIVERDTPGFSIGKIEHKLGIRASSTAELIFEDMRVPDENMLGERGKGFYIALDAYDGGRIGIAAQATGIARAAFEESVAYAKERKQFGKPIAEFQAIQWKIADMAMLIEAARLLYLKAAFLKDRGENYVVASAYAKLFASDVAMKVTREAIQVHGGYGYTEDFDVERHYRDAKITEIYEGTSEAHRLTIARAFLRNK